MLNFLRRRRKKAAASSRDAYDVATSQNTTYKRVANVIPTNAGATKVFGSSEVTRNASPADTVDSDAVVAFGFSRVAKTNGDGP